MTTTKIVRAYELIGHHGQFKIPGRRAVYEAVLYNESTARSDRVRLARVDTQNGIRQVQVWIDWDQPVEVIADEDEEN